MTARYTRMHTILVEKFSPQFIELIDNSHQHQVPSDGESHFKLTLVSEQFQNLSRLERHRLVHQCIAHERIAHEQQTKLHAFTMNLHSPEEWASQPKIRKAPPCHRR